MLKAGVIRAVLRVAFPAATLLSACGAQAQGAAINLEQSGGCVWDGSHDVAPCIQAAINAASHGGGTVLLPAGVWPLGKALKLASNVTLTGDPAGTTFEPAAGDIDNPVLLGGRSIQNVTISAIIFDGGGKDFPDRNPVITVTTGGHLLFDHVTVQNTRGMAMLLQGGVHDSGVRDSRFIDDGNHWKSSSAKSDRQQGLVFCCGGGNINNFAIGNVFNAIGLDALQIANQDRFTATGNVFNLQSAELTQVKAPDYPAGIFALESNHVTIAGNQISDAAGNGIDAPGLQNSTISGNVITGSGGAGIGLFQGYDKTTQTSQVMVTGNTVTNNVQWAHSSFKGGITIAGGTPSGITLSGNNVADTQGAKTQLYGVQIHTSAPVPGLVIAANNQLSGNKTAAISGQ